MTTLKAPTYRAGSAAARLSRALSIAALGWAAGGCHVDAPGSAAASGGAPAPSASVAASAVAAQPRSAAWQRARDGGDPIDCEAVAREAGATELVAALDDAAFAAVAR
ncbi:MAG TPA: hypothetical protein VL400_15380, partial [Polyangiaceae bacterium]|nr:hypothetical protein [Polyangiaceae bacterium]